MPRTATRYVCQQCGFTSPRWLGRCPDCGGWNSLVEEAAPPPTREKRGSTGGAVPEPITQVDPTDGIRLRSGVPELDRVLGGGIVPGSVVLVGGDPGIGKSTLLTQVAALLAQTAPEVFGAALYVSGEESARQIRLRAERLGAMRDHLLVLNETDCEKIVQAACAAKAHLLVIDSIQTMEDSALESAPGTVGQVRAAAAAFSRHARESGCPVFLIGHVTKEGYLAGPRVLEHMVDTVLYFEGDRRQAYRVLRAVKNRFGSTDEIGLFEMRESGLEAIENPSAALLAERSAEASGSAVAPILEGSRAILVEVQALVARSFLANPRRTSTGIELNRLHMLLAVLEKRLGLRLGDQDVYLNIAGGLRVLEPSADLATVLAVASSFRERPVERATVAIGEVGLAGEIREVPHIEKRLREAARLGFTRALVPRHAMQRIGGSGEMELVGVRNVREALEAALEESR